MLAPIVLPAEYWTTLPTLKAGLRRKNSSGGLYTVVGSGPAYCDGGWETSLRRLTCESQGISRPSSMRRETWACTAAAGFCATAAATISWSARKPGDMCSSASPFFPAAASAYSRLASSAFDAQGKAAGSFAAASTMNSESPRTLASAPWRADPQPLSAARRRKAWSLRSLTDAPAIAAPLTRRQARTKSGSSRRACAASWRAAPLCRTASRTSSRSLRRSADA
mmetsp:Transcript_34093/g.95877  ORF Transcript_34093/g.95877 Transcript_34093/m.95877 type:complete len:224 (-) Transcript_34093:944-1615(-)